MAGEISSLRGALQQLLHDLGLERRLKSEQIDVIWPQVVGPTIAKIAHPQQFRHGTLFMTVIDNIWMQELKLQERDLIDRLNDALGEPLVGRLFLRLGHMSIAPLLQQDEAAPTSQPAMPPSPQEETVLEREVAGVRDPELREMLKRLRRRMLTAKGTVEAGKPQMDADERR